MQYKYTVTLCAEELFCNAMYSTMLSVRNGFELSFLPKYECLFSGNIIYKNNAGPIEIRIAPITRY